jgi:hypothetical protein
MSGSLHVQTSVGTCMVERQLCSSSYSFNVSGYLHQSHASKHIDRHRQLNVCEKLRR